jgi:hypothetical protein
MTERRSFLFDETSSTAPAKLPELEFVTVMRASDKTSVDTTGNTNPDQRARECNGSSPFRADPRPPEKQSLTTTIDFSGLRGSIVLRAVGENGLLPQALQVPVFARALDAGAELKPLRAPDSLHTRADVLKELKPADRDRFELLCLERSSVTHPEEQAKKDKQLREFLTERLGASISQVGWTSALEPAKFADQLAKLSAGRAADGKPLIDQVKQLLLERATPTIQDRTKWTEFSTNLSNFLLRAKHTGMSDEAATETILHIARILDPSNRPKHGDPSLLVRGILRNAADPTAIDQGGHNTCNVTTVECRLYTREPQSAAKLVADVAMNGEFKTADGTVIKPRTLGVDGEAGTDPTPDGWRNYASQIFQITAINVHWNRKDTLPGGKEAGVGNIHYCQGGPGEPSEYLLNCSKVPPEVHRFSTIDSDHPWLGLPEMSDVHEQITGRPSVNFGIERWFNSGESRGCFKVSSLDEFKDRLSRMAAERAFPVILVVDAAKKPIGSGDGGFGPHVVTVTAYDPNTGMLTIDNQWGKGADMTDLPGQRTRASAADMWDNMSQLPSSDFIWQHIKRSVKDIGPTDAVNPGIAALSMKGLRYGIFGSAPSHLKLGFESLARRGVPFGATALAASETQLGRIGLRGSTALGAIGIAFLANDLRSAFREGTAHGLGKTARIGIDSMSYELGALTGGGLARLTRLSRWAPGKAGLVITTGLVAATLMDRIAGESVEIGTSYLYERARESIKEWWKK